MISNNTIKTEKPNINFHYEDIINYLKKQNAILELPKTSRKTKRIIQNEYKHYIEIALEPIPTTNSMERFMEKHLLLI